MGDCHAAQGDGELCGTGGMPGSGYCTVDLKKNIGLDVRYWKRQPDYVRDPM